MKLWGGRFTKETNELVNNFNASISFDQKFYKQDIEGSIAHATMLGKQGIIPESESEQIVEGLKGILADIESGKLEITDEYEDIHTFMEATLIERIGDAGKRLHTGRSRNDQVALDMRLFTRQEVLNTDAELKELMAVILRIMKENTHTFMPGFTHLQKAQPVTVAHHFGAYFEMFKRDRSRLHDIYERMNYCPLGAGALAGTTYPLDRELTASLLGFYGPTLNSMDSVSDRDYLIEFLLKVEGADEKAYWLYLDMPVSAALKTLDRFLRDIWLECCGHESAFFVGNYEQLSKNTMVGMLRDGLKLHYEYDFGSTTELTITVVGTLLRPKQRRSVRLLGRNEPIRFLCGKCGKEADWICCECEWADQYPYFCEDCMESHPHDSALPIVNSPRMGVCGYCGEDDVYTFDPAPFLK